MARVAGVEIPDSKRVEIALTYIYGIGRPLSQRALAETGISPDKKVRELTDQELSRLREYIERNYRVEGDLRREVAESIKRLVEIRCYRGIRHQRGLPVRGQRTRTNARSRKGPRKTVGGRAKRARK